MRDHRHDGGSPGTTPTQATVLEIEGKQIEGNQDAPAAQSAMISDVDSGEDSVNGASSPPTASTFSSSFPPIPASDADRLPRPDSVILGTAAALFRGSPCLRLHSPSTVRVPPDRIASFLRRLPVALLSHRVLSRVALITSVTLEIGAPRSGRRRRFSACHRGYREIEKIGLGFLCVVRFGPRRGPALPGMGVSRR